MSGWCVRWARRLWAGEAGWAGRVASVVLLPLSGAWRMAVTGRNAWYDHHPATPVTGLRVVSVGNLAVGGTGKTPLASWIAREIEASGPRTAVLLRGYGSDEKALHERWRPAGLTVVDADRRAGAERARNLGARVVVLDDGFQHRRLPRDLDLVLLAVEDGIPGAVLPRGRYREPVTSLRRADGLVLTRRAASVAAARDLETRLTARLGRGGPSVAGCVRLAPGLLVRLSADWMTGAVAPSPDTATRLDTPLVCTAVARPEAVLRDVASLATGRVDLMSFPDHHEFSARDATAIAATASGRPIVVTEKDAVKLVRRLDGLPDVWVLEQRLEWDWGEDHVRALILDASPVEAELR